MLTGRDLWAAIIERLLSNEPLREQFFADPEAVLQPYHLDARDVRWFSRIRSLADLQKRQQEFPSSTLSGSAPAGPAPKGGDLEEAAAEDETIRVVNTGFASEDEPETPLSPERPLPTATSHYFWLEVGEPVEGSIELVPTALPEDLPPKARLQVALFGFNSEFELTPDAEVGELEVQEDGSAIVVRDAHVPPSLRGANELLNKRLFFPVNTPPAEGEHHLRCNIYYRQNLIQSRLITMHVSANPQSMPGALVSVLDYNLSHSLNGRQLQGMGENRLSIMLNDNGNGTHGLRFFGADDTTQTKVLFKNDAELAEVGLQDLINQAREAYRKVAWGGGLYDSSKKYRYYQNVTIEQLLGDLVLLAKSGYRFYVTLIKKLANGRSGARELRDLMLTGGQIQIAAKRDARLIIPAALFYDYPLDASLAPSAYKLCQGFQEALQGNAPLEKSDCFQGKCPSHGDRETVCPSGFWGYRHRLGLPLDIASAPDAPVAIECPDKVEFTISVSTDPNFVMRKEHAEHLQELQAGMIWNLADTRDESLGAMAETSPHVVYFYCHGGLDGTIPFIHVGDPKKDRGITPDNLSAYDIYWEKRRPLVFINGCHTTALEPDSAIDLVTAFVEESAAAGVIGTEITLFEPIAVAFGEACMQRFLVQRQTIGESVRGARLSMLKAMNPLGLVYIPYVMANLKLV